MTVSFDTADPARIGLPALGRPKVTVFLTISGLMVKTRTAAPIEKTGHFRFVPQNRSQITVGRGFRRVRSIVRYARSIAGSGVLIIPQPVVYGISCRFQYDSFLMRIRPLERPGSCHPSNRTRSLISSGDIPSVYV